MMGSQEVHGENMLNTLLQKKYLLTFSVIREKGHTFFDCYQYNVRWILFASPSHHSTAFRSLTLLSAGETSFFYITHITVSHVHSILFLDF